MTALPDGWRETADPDATFPSGMCGEPKVCNDCPSNFLCRMKAGMEWATIKGREHTEATTTKESDDGSAQA